jgi:hypothetical protein
MTFGRNELIELIMAFGRNELIKPNDVSPRLIVTFFKPNANIPSSNSKAEMHKAVLDSRERQPNDRIIDINPLLSLPFQEARMITPSLSRKFIVESFSEGARVPTSKLIVIYSKKFLHFREDCIIICEGEWEEQSQQPKHDLVDHYGVIGRADLINLLKFVGYNGLVKCNGLVDFIGIVGFVGLDRLVRIVGLSCFDDIIGLVDLVKIGISIVSQEVSLVGLVDLGLVGHPGFGLVGYTGLGLDGSSLIDRISLVGPIGFSGISGLADQISLISLSDLAMISLVGSLASFVRLLISLIGVIGLGLIASSASVASLARRLISFISLIGSSTHRLFCERLATAVNEATKLTWRRKQAAALGVATLRLSANEIANATISYYYAVTSLHMHSLVREKMWWWLALARKKMWRWIASFGESYSGDVLQYAKQLFSLRLPQMTKYCVMRECDNIHPWISTTGDLAFSHQQEFTVLNSQKGFRRSLPEISLFSLSSLFD